MNSRKELYYVTFKTRAGWIGILGSEEQLKRTTLPQKTEDQAKLNLDPLDKAHFSPTIFQALVEQYNVYFDGKRIEFSVNFNLSETTEFERKVWETTIKIPFGETRSYAWLARQINQPLAARGVGHALGRNPFPIIVPCHRVIGSDGTLRGFGGGLEMKQYLLNLEANKN